MNLPPRTNIVREWGFGKCWPYCDCGWIGRTRKLTDENRLKAAQDIRNHVKQCKLHLTTR